VTSVASMGHRMDGTGFGAQLFDEDHGRIVRRISTSEAAATVIAFHYLHRRPPMSHAFGLVDGGRLVGVCTFGTPPSRHLTVGVYPEHPELVQELNRLWIHDDQPHGTASWFVSRCLRQLPPLIVVSYADTKQGHTGGVYRALSWRYAGWTDMDRKTPRLDYVPLDEHKHSREATRSGVLRTERRVPKVRFWTTTGTPAQRRALSASCQWPSLSWTDQPPPTASQLIKENP